MTTVLVTGAGGGIGMSIIKALSLRDYRVIGVDSSPLAPGLFAGVDASVVVPEVNWHGYINALVDVCNSHHVDVLIPGSDHELRALAASKELIEKRTPTIVMVSPWGSVQKMSDKSIMPVWLVENRFLAPKTSTMMGEASHPPIPYPFVAKPGIGSGSGNSFVVCEEDDKTPLRRGFLYCVQEYLKGDEFTTSVMVGRDGLVYDIMTLRRLSPKIGEGHQMIARQTYDPGIVATNELRDIAEALKTIGCCNIQWKFRGARPVSFEINMRFPGSTIICAAAGMNGPAMAVEDLLTGNHTRHNHRSLTCLRHLSEVYVPTTGAPFTLENLPCASASPEGLGSNRKHE